MEFEYVNWHSDQPSQLYSDREKITKVFIHLFRNAFKFTPSGKVKFGYTIDSKEIKQLKFFVKDTGIGIPENKRSVIFDQFQQAEDCYKIKYGGTGIGLSIAKYNVELLGGQIGVDSTPGKGSMFYFTIPITEPESICNKL
ncbi:GAF sensor hybrid histidine kinase [Aquipluma nitroreducens]|uniref:histidine kinase n=2 Tax=Aquipluma nitroreducens TaxID=2010828 RepID=A0A5K7S4G5_9BACT|nr:GAF sensor hybrid histidine kinase [Aquipluma nitroreducens]